MNVPLVQCLARPARHVSCRSAFLPARSVTRLQRTRPLIRASPLASTLGSSRCFSWNPFGGASSKTEVPPLPPSPSPQSHIQADVQENISAAANTSSQVSADTSFTPPFVDGSTVETLSDSLSNTAGTLASHPVPMQYGDMAALGLVSWTPAGLVPWLLELTHVSTGLPWWSVIMITTIGARIVLFPLVVRAQRTQGRLAPLQPKLTELRDQANKARAEGDRILAQHTMQQHMAILRKNEINPLDSLVTAAAQICVQFGFFLGLRRMCAVPVEQLQVSGFGWITDLTAADPYYILPILNYAMINLQLSVSKRDMLAVGSPSSLHILNGLRILTFLSLPVVAFLPAALNVHFITSLVIITSQTIILRIPAVRRTLNLPVLQTSLQQRFPTLKESVTYLKEWYGTRMREAQIQAQDRERKMRMVQKAPRK